MWLNKTGLIVDYSVFALVLYRMLHSIFTGRGYFLSIGVLGIIFISTHILKQIQTDENKVVDIISKISCFSIIFICLASW